MAAYRRRRMGQRNTGLGWMVATTTTTAAAAGITCVLTLKW